MPYSYSQRSTFIIIRVIELVASSSSINYEAQRYFYIIPWRTKCWHLSQIEKMPCLNKCTLGLPSQHASDNSFSQFLLLSTVGSGARQRIKKEQHIDVRSYFRNNISVRLNILNRDRREILWSEEIYWMEKGVGWGVSSIGLSCLLSWSQNLVVQNFNEAYKLLSLFLNSPGRFRCWYAAFDPRHNKIPVVVPIDWPILIVVELVVTKHK